MRNQLQQSKSRKAGADTPLYTPLMPVVAFLDSALHSLPVSHEGSDSSALCHAAVAAATAEKKRKKKKRKLADGQVRFSPAVPVAPMHPCLALLHADLVEYHNKDKDARLCRHVADWISQDDEMRSHTLCHCFAHDLP